MTARMEQLRGMLEKPGGAGDAFLLYAMALELKKGGDRAGALDYLARTLAVDPHYHYAYYQQGQVLEGQGDVEGAKASYDAGIVRAQAAGDGKALGELQGAREMLE